VFQFLKSADVDFHQFMGESWMEVSSPSLAINKVPSAIQNKVQGAKNKVVKPHRTKKCLALIRKLKSSYQT
jgi:hypothetical protein